MTWGAHSGNDGESDVGADDTTVDPSSDEIRGMGTDELAGTGAGAGSGVVCISSL